MPQKSKRLQILGSFGNGLKVVIGSEEPTSPNTIWFNTSFNKPETKIFNLSLEELTDNSIAMINIEDGTIYSIDDNLKIEENDDGKYSYLII